MTERRPRLAATIIRTWCVERRVRPLTTSRWTLPVRYSEGVNQGSTITRPP